MECNTLCVKSCFESGILKQEAHALLTIPNLASQPTGDVSPNLAAVCHCVPDPRLLFHPSGTESLRFVRHQIMSTFIPTPTRMAQNTNTKT